MALPVGMRCGGTCDRVPLRMDHAVLHRSALQAGEVDRRGVADGTGDEHHRGACGGDGDAGDSCAGNLVGAVVELLLRCAGIGWSVGRNGLREGHLWNGDRHDGNAELRGVHSGDGYLWTDHRQRGRNY